MNLPNKLTLGRLWLTAAFTVVLSLPTDSAWVYPAALVIFLVASITDWLDGYIARRDNLITDFGKLMDPLVDKILTAAAFILLIPTGLISPWVVIIIISREFAITGLRLIASAKGQILPAERLGKYKTIFQMLAIIYLLSFLSLQSLPALAANSGFLQGGEWIGHAIITIAVILTAWSGVSYLHKNRSLLADA